MRIAMLLHKSVEFDSRVRREADALVGAGHQVVVLELAPESTGGPASFERRSVLPPGWIRHRLPRSMHRPLMLLWFVHGVVGSGADVIHAHDAAMLLPGIIGARLTGAKLVYDSHEFAAGVPYREKGWAWFVTAVERLVMPRCAGVITVSDGIAMRLADRYRLPKPPIVVRNVSALTRAGRGGLRERAGVGLETPLVLHQGAPAPARGCEVLVDAVARVDGLHLAFLGDPDPGYGQVLVNQIHQRGIEDRVTLLPSVPLTELLAYTAEADLGVTLLAGTCENHRLALPNKLFEYIAAGVPVLASALPEIERLVARHGIGWCVAPDDPIAVADALRVAVAARNDVGLSKRLEEAGKALAWGQEQNRLTDLYARLDEPGCR